MLTSTHFIGCLAVTLYFVHGIAIGAVTPTPGSVSSLTYYPPSSGGTGGGSADGSDGARGESLSKCYRGKHANDATYYLNADSFYTLEKIKVYYKIFGGDGGGSSNGGGGGSSVLMLNGATVAFGAGGSGGQIAQEVRGEFEVKPGDTLRLITGGGGGAGVAGAAGGGGGAGWFGGGAGGSNSPGAGGSNVAGAGGQGGFFGTSGVGNQGGVSTFPDGSTAPSGSATTANIPSLGGGYYYLASNAKSYRWPATATRVGSPGAPNGNASYACFSGRIGGFGGSLGVGGSHPVELHSKCSTDAGYVQTGFNGNIYSIINEGNPNYRNVYMAKSIDFAEPTSFTSTRINNGSSEYNGGQTGALGSIPGQIVLYYNAIDCSLF